MERIKFALVPGVYGNCRAGVRGGCGCGGPLPTPISGTVAVPAGADPNGAWKVSVTFVSADAGTPVPPPAPIPGTTDASVAYNVAITAK